ncbi:MAG: hypothetical protein ACPKQO_10445 [Nitrososphaeraceae archaeon]
MKYYYDKNGVPFIKIGKGQFISADKQFSHNQRKSRKCGKTTDNGYHYDTQTWGALKKAWRAYKIAINKEEYDNIKKYAKIILILQYELGLPLDDFSHVGVYSEDIDFKKEIEDY